MSVMVKRRVHVAAAAMISTDQKHVLIARRPSNVDHGGLWEFPGGKLAPYETGLEGLKRELHEELGVEIIFTAGDKVSEVKWTKNFKSFIFLLFCQLNF